MSFMVHSHAAFPAGGGGFPTDYVSHYSMDNISGSTLVDESGNYDGTITGATQVASDHGFALSFDAVDDEVLFPAESEITTAFSIVIRVKFDSLVDQNVVCRTSAAGPLVNLPIQLKLGSSGRLTGRIWDGSGKEVLSDSAVTIGQEYDVILTGKNGGTLKLYVDKTLQASTQSIGTLEVQDRWQMAVPTQLGAGRLGGDTDDLYLFKRELSQAEVNLY